MAIFNFPEEKHIYLWQLPVFLLPWREGRRELVTPLSFQSNLWLYVNWYFLWYSSYHGKTVIWILHITPFPFCFSFPSLPYKMSPISGFFCFAFENRKKDHQWKKPLSSVLRFGQVVTFKMLYTAAQYLLSHMLLLTGHFFFDRFICSPQISEDLCSNVKTVAQNTWQGVLAQKLTVMWAILRLIAKESVLFISFNLNCFCLQQWLEML